jgi:hypothetical protein
MMRVIPNCRRAQRILSPLAGVLRNLPLTFLPSSRAVANPAKGRVKRGPGTQEPRPGSCGSRTQAPATATWVPGPRFPSRSRVSLRPGMTGEVLSFATVLLREKGDENGHAS